MRQPQQATSLNLANATTLLRLLLWDCQGPSWMGTYTSPMIVETKLQPATNVLLSLCNDSELDMYSLELVTATKLPL
jgi:hypothetical protein